MKNQYAALVAVVVAVLVSSQVMRPSEHQRMVKEVAELNAAMPRKIDEVTTQTGVTLGEHVVINDYLVSLPLDNDAATTEALRTDVLKQACARPDARKLLSRGWSIDNRYGVKTPHGQDRIVVRIKPGDCG